MKEEHVTLPASTNTVNLTLHYFCRLSFSPTSPFPFPVPISCPSGQFLSFPFSYPVKSIFFYFPFPFPFFNPQTNYPLSPWLAAICEFSLRIKMGGMGPAMRNIGKRPEIQTIKFVSSASIHKD
jgi:hypothetical protein